MSRATRIFLVAASVLAVNSALAKSTRSTVTFLSECACQNSHGVDRWRIWCPIRRRIFSWTRTTFPFHITTNRTLTLREQPVITVVGKAFYDVDHAPRNQTNRRNNMPSFAVWEIHPVM